MDFDKEKFKTSIRSRLKRNYGKNLDEAEQAVQKSMALYDKDLRIRITLARIQLKKGEIERARETIRLLKSRQSDLSKFDQEALAKLADEASSNRVR